MSAEDKPGGTVDWVGVEKIGENRILDTLCLALRVKSIPEMPQETGTVPTRTRAKQNCEFFVLAELTRRGWTAALTAQLTIALDST